jgi:hypothetical protein
MLVHFSQKHLVTLNRRHPSERHPSERHDGRLVNFLLKDPIPDAGQWDMVVNIVEKYGETIQRFAK